jgi:hypothetical protein
MRGWTSELQSSVSLFKSNDVCLYKEKQALENIAHKLINTAVALWFNINCTVVQLTDARNSEELVEGTINMSWQEMKHQHLAKRRREISNSNKNSRKTQEVNNT